MHELKATSPKERTSQTAKEVYFKAAVPIVVSRCNFPSVAVSVGFAFVPFQEYKQLCSSSTQKFPKHPAGSKQLQHPPPTVKSLVTPTVKVMASRVGLTLWLYGSSKKQVQWPKQPMLWLWVWLPLWLWESREKASLVTQAVRVMTVTPTSRSRQKKPHLWFSHTDSSVDI